MDDKNSSVNDHVEEKGNEPVKSVNVHSVALAAAIEAQQPKPLSKGMLKLYMIMGIGYLVSTLNGFGKIQSNYQNVR